MIKFAIAFILGMFSIFSPCVLPVIPLLFAASRGKIFDLLLIGVGLLTNMALIGAFASLISATILRYVAYIFLLFFGIILIFNKSESYFIASRFSPKFLTITSKTSSFILGFLLAFIWLPCIAPFLAIAFSQAILSSPKYSPLIMLSYGVGMIFSILLILVTGKLVGKKLSIKPVHQKIMNRIAGIVIILYLFYFIISP